jgi:hypothetical protein
MCNKKKKEGVSSRTISSPTADPPQVLVFIKTRKLAVILSN